LCIYQRRIVGCAFYMYDRIMDGMPYRLAYGMNYDPPVNDRS